MKKQKESGENIVEEDMTLSQLKKHKKK